MIRAVGDKRHLARALDLSSDATLMLGAQARGPTREDLPQLVHIALQLIRLLIGQLNFVLTELAVLAIFRLELGTGFDASSLSSFHKDLEWDFFFTSYDRLCGRGRDGFAFGWCFFFATAEEDDVLRDNLGDLARLALLRLKGVDAQASFYGDLTALRQKIDAVLGLRPPDDDGDKRRFFLEVAIAVTPSSVDRDLKARPRRPVLGVAQFRIACEIPY